MKIRFFPWGVLTLLCLALSLFFVVYPLAGLILNSFRAKGGGFGLDGLRMFLANPEYFAALGNTLILAISVTLLATGLGVPFAYLVARYDFPFKGIVSVLPLATIVIPEVIVCQSWLLILGNNGILTTALRGWGIQLPSFYGWGGMIFVMTLVYYTYIYLGMLAALKGFDRQLGEASISLGRSPAETFWRVVLPTMLPAILVNGMIVFTLVVGNFAVAAILGGRIPLLSSMTYSAFVAETGGSPVMQSTLSLVMILIVGSVLLVQKHVVERRSFIMAQGRAPLPAAVRGGTAVLMTIGVVAMVLLSLLPLGAVFIGAFTATRGPVAQWGTFSLEPMRQALSFGVEPIVNSLTFASIATLAGTAFATLASYLIVKKRSLLSHILDYVVVLPLTISGTVLGIALVNAFNSGLIILTGSAAIMVATYVIRRLPFSTRAASSSLYNIPDSLEEASQSLGVPPVESFFRVVAPLMAASIGAAGCLMWATTLSELSASIVVYGGGLETLPIAIFRQVDSGRVVQASAYGAILVMLIVLPIAFMVKVLRIPLFSASR